GNQEGLDGERGDDGERGGCAGDGAEDIADDGLVGGGVGRGDGREAQSGLSGGREGAGVLAQPLIGRVGADCADAEFGVGACVVDATGWLRNNDWVDDTQQGRGRGGD